MSMDKSIQVQCHQSSKRRPIAQRRRRNVLEMTLVGVLIACMASSGQWSADGFAPCIPSALPPKARSPWSVNPPRCLFSSPTSSNSISSTPRRRAPNKRIQLRWIIQKVEKETDGCTDLLDAMTMLGEAKTQSQILNAGRQLENLSIASSSTQYSLVVQERVVKAAAMTGLLSLALNLTEGMIENHNFLPSVVTQDALCNALRRAGRIGQLEALIHQLGAMARKQSTHMSVISFNTFLAALCNVATGKKVDSKRVTIEATSRGDQLNKAFSFLMGNSSETQLGAVPDSVSFGTVLQAAASVGNGTMADLLWQEMERKEIQPDIVAYNARLRVAGKTGLNRNEQVLRIWDEIQTNPRLKPDRYTVDLMVLPLIREGRIGDVEALLDGFVTQNSEFVVSNAFAAFLGSLVRAGEVSSARALFETYIEPTFLPSVSTTAGMMRMVRAKAHHFNVLLEGFQHAVNTPNATEAYKEGWELYRMMRESTSVCPDSYTVTSMMALCQTSAQLSKLLYNATTEYGVQLKSVVLRAAITAYGEVGDPSSACLLFAMYAGSSPGLREWNVLLGALARSSKREPGALLRPYKAAAAKDLIQKDVKQHPLLDFVKETTTCESVLRLLNEMRGNGALEGIRLPRPDAQTFCIAASTLQHNAPNGAVAMELFHNATNSGIPADGRFVNAIFRCFGDDVDGAISAWKNVVRGYCIAYENRSRQSAPSIHRTRGKNLIASYNGLMYVCGRACRPDIAVRLAYAMKREGLDPDEISLNCYRGGKHARAALGTEAAGLAAKLNLFRPYESILEVECTKYDRNDKRRSNDRRVRIIV